MDPEKIAPDEVADAPGEPADSAPDADAADVEGHSLSMILGVNALSREKQSERRRAAAGDELKPLSKSFPNMRRERRS